MLVALAAVFMLVVSPVAMGDESTYQIAALYRSGCPGFAIESVRGAISSCVEIPQDIWPVEGEYSVAADGTIVFSGGGAIWVVSPTGSVSMIDSSPYDSRPSISYDGSKVVFLRDDPADNSSTIYSISSDGSGLQEVVSSEPAWSLRVPVISPDGSSIAYWCWPGVNEDTTSTGCGPLTDGSYRYAGLMRVNIDGRGSRMIVIGPGSNLEPVGPTGLSWSPNGQWLAMDGVDSVYVGPGTWTAQRQLFEYHTDGSDLFNNLDPTRQITQASPATDPWGPTLAQFSPDGSQLLYMDARDGRGDQGNFSYLIGVDGSNPHQVFLDPDTICANGSCESPSYGAFIPTATPGAPPPLVDMTHITVPSVRSLSLAAATAALASDNLTVGTVTYSGSGGTGTVAAHTPSAHAAAQSAVGTVVAQSPSAGAVAHRTQKVGPPVNLVVSGPRPSQRLTVYRRGTGSGTVTSRPSGISCGSKCSYTFANRTLVTLTANPASGSAFAGWTGACTGTTKTCHVSMPTALAATATFVALKRLTVTVAGPGKGQVTSSPTGISCSLGKCAHTFTAGTVLTLTATAKSGSTFTGWTGACSGTGSCIIKMSAAKSVKATFAHT
jgi:hypothetical protein